MRKTATIALFVFAPCLAALPALADEPDGHKADAAKTTNGDAAKPVDPAKAAADAAKAAEAAKAAAAKRAALVKLGTEKCNGGELDEGLNALDAAWSQKQDTELALVLAGCEVKAQRWPGAAEHLAYALRVISDPEQRKGIEPTFVNVRARVGAVKVAVNIEGADVFVEDRYAGTSPLAAEVYVLPGRARVSAKKPGFGEVQKAVDVPANGKAELAIELVDENTSAQASRPPARRSRTPAYVLGGLTLVTAGIGAGLVGAGVAKGSGADELLGELQGSYGTAPCPTNAGCTTLKDLRTGHDSLVNAGIGVFGVSGALLVSTVIYGLWATRAPDSVGGYAPKPPLTAVSAGISFTPTASASGGGLVVRGAF